MEPLISVIVPVYQVEPYLRKCVDSILNQTYPNLEVILVDDGSPDNCGAICDEYAAADDRVVVIHKTNGGLSDARNAGMAAMTGDYLTFVDSDDWVAPELYSNIMALHPFDVAVFGCVFVDEKGTKTVTHRACTKAERINPARNYSAIEELLNTSLFGYACNKIYHANVIQQLRFEQIPLREDLAFNLDVFKRANRVLLSDETGYFYLQRNGSTLHSAYSGTVPAPKSVIHHVETLYSDAAQLAGTKCANRIIKMYITDFIIKYIARNGHLPHKEKLEILKELFASGRLRKAFHIFREEGRMFVFFTICYKLNLPGLFYQAMRGKWEYE